MEAQAATETVIELLNINSLRESWPSLPQRSRRICFSRLPRPEAEDFFLSLDAHDQVELLSELSLLEKRSWLRLLPPDDAADLIQRISVKDRNEYLSLIDESTRSEVIA